MRLQIFAIVAVAALAAAFGYVEYRERQSAKQAVARERLEAVIQMEKDIEKISNLAERGRAMRRLCIDQRLRYDFATGKCDKRAIDPNSQERSGD